MENNKLFNQNLLKIQECDELLYSELEKFDFSNCKIESVKIERALDETKVIKVEKDSYDWYFNSKYEPVKVANQWIDKLGKIESIASVVVFGLGNGIILKELLRRTSKNVFFLVYEPSVEVFLKIMQEIDLSFLEERVFFLVEGINDFYLEGVVGAFVTYENISVCKFVGHPNYWSCYQEEGVRYLKRLQGMIKGIDIANNTKMALGEGYYKNILMNIKYLNQVSLLDQIMNKCGVDIPRELPAIVVSAGPSLSKNIKELKKAKGKAFIIATDSALRGLFNEDIIPDAFATIDPLKPLNRFDDDRINHIPLITTESGRYEVLERHKDKKILANNTCGFGNRFYELQKINYQANDFGGSVATFAYTIARLMGFQTIILIGQDLAFTDETRYYEGAKEWNHLDEMPQQLQTEVEDIHGNMVKTSKDMAVYLEWFEKQIENYEWIETIDATEGGAKIHGSRIMELSQVIEEKCNIKFDFTEYLRNIPVYTNNEDFKNYVQTIPKEYKKLFKDTLIGIDLYRKLIDMIRLKTDNNHNMKEMTQEISKITKEIEDNLVYSHIQHKLEKIEYTILNNLGVSLEDEYEDALQVASRGKLILEALKQVLEDEVLLEVKKVVGQIEFGA